MIPVVGEISFSNFRFKLAFALFVTLGLWGGMLLPWHTSSPEPLISPLISGFRIHPETGDLIPKKKENFYSLDYGATGAVDLPDAYFQGDKRWKPNGESPQLALPRWNPFIGSGYPAHLNGVHEDHSLLRRLVIQFPGDSGRDVLNFLRALILTTGFLFLLALFTQNHWILVLGTVLGSFNHYFGSYFDISFMDGDILAPWLLFGFFWCLSIEKEKKAQSSYLFALGLGLFVGNQNFLQTQFNYLILSVLLGLWGLYKNPKRSVIFLSLFAAGIMAWLIPRGLQYQKYWSEFLTSRSSGTCMLTQGHTWAQIWRDSVYYWAHRHPHPFLVFPIGALPFILLSFRQKRLWGVALLWGATVYFFAQGLPQWSCQIPIVSGVRFWRHSLVWMQSLALLLTLLGIEDFTNWLKSFSSRQVTAGQPLPSKMLHGIALFLVFALAVFPWAHTFSFNSKMLSGKVADKLPPFSRENSVASQSYFSFDRLGQISQQEDRRHFSPSHILVPNWSSVFGIMDLRLLEAIYIERFHQLTTLPDEIWERDPQHKIVPDRFMFWKSVSEFAHPQAATVLALHRVSLISLFEKDLADFPEKGFYSKENCKRLDGIPNLIITLKCQNVGGVGFFPSKIVFQKQDESDGAFLARLRSVPAVEAAQVAFIGWPKHRMNSFLHSRESGSFALDELPSWWNQDQLNSGGTHSAKVLWRKADSVAYEVSTTTQGSLFLLADNDFPGWTASLDDLQVPIFRANHAFKSVFVPEGTHQLVFRYEN